MARQAGIGGGMGAVAVQILALALLAGAPGVAGQRGLLREVDREELQRLFYGESVLFVKFYAPWCTHCKKVQPVLEEVAQQTYKEQLPVDVVKMNCEEKENRQTCKSFGVEGFPTMKLMLGREQEKYVGGRDFDSFMNTIRLWCSPPVTEIEKGMLGEFPPKGGDKDMAAFVFVGSPSEEQRAGYHRLALKRQRDVWLGYAPDPSRKEVGPVPSNRPWRSRSHSRWLTPDPSWRPTASTASPASPPSTPRPRWSPPRSSSRKARVSACSGRGA